MTTKPSRLITEIWAAVFTIFGLAGCAGETSTTSTPDVQVALPTSNKPVNSPAIAPSLTASTPKTSQPTITTFKCVQQSTGQSTGWATIAERGNIVSKSPLLTWNSKEFGTDWTPEQRCKTVSQRLTDAVAKNGGKLANLDLTTGKIDNGYTVVCMITARQKSCNRNNVLFTLKKENSQNPSAILAKITNFAKGDASNPPIAESGNIPQFIPLETLVNRVLGRETGF
jgi:Circadian oscillating protein COP23